MDRENRVLSIIERCLDLLVTKEAKAPSRVVPIATKQEKEHTPEKQVELPSIAQEIQKEVKDQKGAGSKIKIPTVEYGKKIPWISVLRVSQNLSQRAVAKAVGISDSTLGNIEKLRRKAKRSEQEAIATVLGESKEELFDSSGWARPYEYGN